MIDTTSAWFRFTIGRRPDFVLKFWHDPYEMTLLPDGRAIIKGTTDTAIARSLYPRYVGS